MGSVPKYAWISLSRMPAMSFQGTSGYLDRRDAGMCFAVSPMISIHWIEANNVFFIGMELFIRDLPRELLDPADIIDDVL
jgi:hypothetical protein